MYNNIIVLRRHLANCQLLLFLMFQLLSVLSCQCTNLLGVGYVFMYQKNCSSTQSVARGVSSVWENVCCVTSWCAGGGASLSYGRQQVMAARDKNKGKRLSLRDTLHGRQVREEKKREREREREREMCVISFPFAASCGQDTT